ncbi:unnamed protein product [Nezara viridula]|uniref:Neuropeptide n=1 Tax=Nezara viridula TaxID=85310 RepID=A0A9P0HDV0_NEZVI|nr:unnamed protein product [Nezara viridula]
MEIKLLAFLLFIGLASAGKIGYFSKSEELTDSTNDSGSSSSSSEENDSAKEDNNSGSKIEVFVNGIDLMEASDESNSSMEDEDTVHHKEIEEIALFAPFQF